MKLTPKTLGILLVSGLAATAAMAVPPALDHVPAQTPVIVGINNLQEVTSNVKHWASVFAPPEAMQGFMMAQMMLGMPGVNAQGSAAVAITIDPERMRGGMVAPEPEVVIVIPVSSYSDFIEGFNGRASDGVDAINLGDSPAFVKDIGDGFAALSNNQDLVEGFSGEAGQIDAIESRLGPIGTQAADENNVFAIIDVQTMRPFLDEGIDQFKQNMEMAAMMGGEAVEGQMNAMVSAMESVADDGRTALIGLGISDEGISLDFAGQFDPESETGDIFSDYGNSSSLLGTVPNIDYIIAFGFDTTSPKLRKLMMSMAKLNKGMSFGPNMEDVMQHTTGQAMVLGSTPGLFAGGLFTNTIQYTRTDNSDDYFEAWKTSMGEMDGKTVNGMIFKTDIAEEPVEIAGHKAYPWSLAMEVDPNDDNAMAMSMATQQIGMLFGGEAGPKGYAVSTDDGVYTTYARNKALIEKALSGEEGPLTDNAGIQAIATHLPENRTAEAYLNVKGLLDMVMPMMAMFGGPTIDDLPEDMLPIGMSLSTGDAGMHSRIFIPASVLDFSADLVKQFAEPAEVEEDDGDEPEPKPRF